MLNTSSALVDVFWAGGDFYLFRQSEIFKEPRTQVGIQPIEYDILSDPLKHIHMFSYFLREYIHWYTLKVQREQKLKFIDYLRWCFKSRF